MELQSKLPNVGTTIFTVMSNLATQHHAVNLSQGFPDFPIASSLIASVNEAMMQGYNQYAPMPGLIQLRQVLANKINILYNTNVDAETEITITPGATYGIYTAFMTILQKDDEVIVLEPAYDSYIPNIELCNAKAVCVPLNSPTFNIDWQKVNEAIHKKTKAIIINTPHNPTGYVWTQEDINELEAIVLKHNIYIISDEVYEHITFDNKKHNSVLQSEILKKNSFAVFSFGKTFHATGWKIGYVVAPAKLMKEYRKIHQYLSFSTNTPMQYALANFVTNENNYNTISIFYENKRNLFLQLFKKLPFTIFTATQGSYFQILGYENMSKINDKDFAVWLTKEMGVAAVPLSAFYSNNNDEKLLRFCFAKKDETLMNAAEKLKDIKARL